MAIRERSPEGVFARGAQDAAFRKARRQWCEQGWDLTECNDSERMWVYVALSHP